MKRLVDYVVTVEIDSGDKPITVPAARAEGRRLLDYCLGTHPGSYRGEHSSQQSSIAHTTVLRTRAAKP